METDVIDWPGFWPATYFVPALLAVWWGAGAGFAAWEGVRVATLTVGLAVSLGAFPEAPACIGQPLDEEGSDG